MQYFTIRRQAFKYRIEPTGEQQRKLRQLAGSCRFVFNKALALQQANREAGEKFIGYVPMAKHLTAWRKGAETPWLKDAPVHPLQHALKDLDRAYSQRAQHLPAYPDAAPQLGRMDKALGDVLASAFEVLGTMWVRVELANRSDSPDNPAEARKLDAMQRDLLRDALRVVKQFKDTLTRSFHLEI